MNFGQLLNPNFTDNMLLASLNWAVILLLSGFILWGLAAFLRGQKSYYWSCVLIALSQYLVTAVVAIVLLVSRQKSLVIFIGSFLTTTLSFFLIYHYIQLRKGRTLLIWFLWLLINIALVGGYVFVWIFLSDTS